MKKRYYTHQQFEKDIKKISIEIRETEKLLNTKFVGIYAIPRGGLIPGVYLSHLLGLPLIWNKNKITKKILVVDEICDSGKTFSQFDNGFTVCLHYKPTISNFKPDIWIRTTREYIIYNWEKKLCKY
jgi:hypoxanthine phosphoribosyltransferase